MVKSFGGTYALGFTYLLTYYIVDRWYVRSVHVDIRNQGFRGSHIVHIVAGSLEPVEKSCSFLLTHIKGLTKRYY